MEKTIDKDCSRPYVICHMVTSLDGKVTGPFLEEEACAEATELYYEINREFKADGFACGSVTMEGSFTGGFYPDLGEFREINVPRTDHIADKAAGYFAVSFDRRGLLGWKTSRIKDEDPGYDNAHVIQVLCEDVADEYLAYLRSVGVSYIFAGKSRDCFDVNEALVKLRSIFGIKLLLLEGGSVINGAFQRADVIDELSLVVAPFIAGDTGKPLFTEGDLQKFSLFQAERREGNAIRLRYRR